jgi:ABC-type arginine transport system permease subunit
MNNFPVQIGVTETAQLLGVAKTTVLRRIIRGDFATVTKLPGLTASYILDRNEVMALSMPNFTDDSVAL